MIDARSARLVGLLAPVVTAFRMNLDANVGEFVRHCKGLLKKWSGSRDLRHQLPSELP
ncbi:hypothetical protein QFZ96_000754 [Paraburkholderia youngii]